MYLVLPFICLQLLTFCNGDNELRRELPTTACPVGFLHLGSRCFKLVRSDKSWDESNIYCHNVFRGQLAVADAPDVYNGLASLMADRFENAWIGAKYFQSYNGFQWVNGKSCCQTPWMLTDDTNGREGQCMVLMNIMPVVYFSQYDCGDHRHFICERKECQIDNCKKYHCPSTGDSSCTQCNTGFHLVENGSLCFDIAAPLHIKCFQACIAVFIKSHTWTDGKDICNARNGHLYVPEIPDEDYSVRNYLEAVITPDKMFWVGGKLLQTKQTQWIDNLSVPSERWSTKPATMNEDLCIAMDPRDGYQLKAVSCTEHLFFICQERTPFNILAVG